MVELLASKTMFDDFANVWTIVAETRTLTAGKPLAMKVAGERVVFFRDGAGKAVALIDQCPHRGVALSLGRVAGGEIECPFHGWRFDGAGRNCGVPWNPDAKTEHLGARALPVREAGGLLWLFTGFEADSEPVVSDTFSLEDAVVCGQAVTWRAHWTRVMENMLDTPHLPFVHRKTIGKQVGPAGGRRMDLRWEDAPFGARIWGSVDGAPRPSHLEYRFPNAMELFIDPPGKLLRLSAICVPEDETTTRLLLLTVRNFARPRALDPAFRWMNRRIAREDQAIVESSLPIRVPAPADEASVRTDGPTLAFRRLYRQRLLGGRVVAPGRAEQ
jgi:phenylpropionate dioxygenase-like ring-hydroxylating dioxygenase large terminal subunit